MSDTPRTIAAEKALDVLLGIAEDDKADLGARIAAACAVIDRLDSFPYRTLEPVE